MATHITESTFTGGRAFLSHVDGHQIAMDVSASEGGSDSGISPKKLMLVSLAGCTGVDIVMILNKMRVAFAEFSIHTAGDLTTEDPMIYRKVTIIYSIRVAEADKSKMEKAVQLSQDKYCGVSAMFREFAELSWQVNYL